MSQSVMYAVHFSLARRRLPSTDEDSSMECLLSLAWQCQVCKPDHRTATGLA